MGGVAGACTGWMIARLHRQQRTALVLAATLFLMLTNVAWMAARIYVLSLAQRAGYAFPSGPGLLVWGMYNVVLFFLPLFVIAGGLSGPRVSRHPKPVRG